MSYNKINTYWLSDNGISGDRGQILHLDIVEGNYPVLWIQTNGDPIIVEFDNKKQQKEIYWNSYVSGSCYDELQWIWDCNLGEVDDLTPNWLNVVEIWLAGFRPENQCQFHEFYRVFADGTIEWLDRSGQWVKDTGPLPEYCDEVTMDSEPPIDPIQPGVGTYYRQERLD